MGLDLLGFFPQVRLARTSLSPRHAATLSHFLKGTNDVPPRIHYPQDALPSHRQSQRMRKLFPHRLYSTEDLDTTHPAIVCCPDHQIIACVRSKAGSTFRQRASRVAPQEQSPSTCDVGLRTAETTTKLLKKNQRLAWDLLNAIAGDTEVRNDEWPGDERQVDEEEESREHRPPNLVRRSFAPPDESWKYSTLL